MARSRSRSRKHCPKGKHGVRSHHRKGTHVSATPKRRSHRRRGSKVRSHCSRKRRRSH